MQMGQTAEKNTAIINVQFVSIIFTIFFISNARHNFHAIGADLKSSNNKHCFFIWQKKILSAKQKYIFIV